MNLPEMLVPVAAITSMVSALIGGGTLISQRVAEPPVIASASYDKPVMPGETILLGWTIDKRLDCGGQNSRVWDGQDGFHLSEPLMAAGLGKTDGPKKFVIPTKVPRRAPPGALTLSIVGSYDCPGLKPIPFRLGPVNLTVK